MSAHAAAVRHTAPRAQRGVATLVTTLVLLLALVLMAGHANRGLVMEQRSSANQLRATQAFEAAEAGIAWAQAMLNRAGRVDARCEPSTAAADTAFVDRVLAWQARTAPEVSRHRAITWTEAGQVRPQQVACWAAGNGAGAWTCHCPRQAAPTWPAAADRDARPAFVLTFTDGPLPGTVWLQSTGCSDAGQACRPPAAAGAVAEADTGEARAELSVLLGLVPALLRAPAAPLTTRQTIDAGAASLGLHNAHPQSGGLLAHAGGAIQASSARLHTVAGEPGALALAAQDAALAAQSPDGLFTTYLGLDRSRWRQQAGVRSIACAGPCDAALDQAEADGHTLLHVPGALLLQGPHTLGSAQRPVLLVVDGEARFEGGVHIHGVVYAQRVHWHTGAGPGWLRGAVLSEGDYTGNGVPDLVWDAAVLDMLRTRWGSWVPVPGSWTDHTP